MKRVSPSVIPVVGPLALVLALALALAPLTPAHATPAPDAPDLYLVAGRDWRGVLPVSVLAGAAEPPTPVLLPEEGKERWFGHFLDRYRAERPVVVLPESRTVSGEGVAGPPTWAEALRFPDVEGAVPSVTRLETAPADVALALAEHVVAVPPEGQPGRPVWLVDGGDYRTGLLAAVAAGAERGVLIPVGSGGITVERALAFAKSRRSPIRWAEGAGDADGAAAVTATARAVAAGARTAGLTLEQVKGPDALTTWAAEAFDVRRPDGTPAHAVLTNPADTRGWFSPPHLSILAPLFAIARHAPLIVTDGSPDDLESDLTAFESAHGNVSHVTLIGDYLALKMREMLDPDEVHEGKENPRIFKVPALAGVTDLKPAEYAVGRLAAEDVHDLSLQIGRILAPERALGSVERPALMLANADEIFVMAELVSIATVKEMENVGWDVAAHYGENIDRDLIFREMPGKQVVVWTGHPQDLTVDYDIGVVDQVLDASLVFLQGCYTLDRNDPYVLVQQGAAGVIGTYMAVYSASGSAFAKTVLDAMLYYAADQGEAMVHARNYLLAYVAMKQQRGHRDWRKTWRAALSFDLWGDPTLSPMTPRQTPAQPPVRLVHEDGMLRFDVPEARFSGISAGRYTLESAAGGQLGSIYTRHDDWGQERRMQPFYFGWVDLPDHETEPELASDVPEEAWVTLWAPHRRRLYVMAHNRAEQTVGRDGFVFRFVSSEEDAVAGGEADAD